MSIFRSEDMNLLKLVMSKDQEYSIIELIGQMEKAHFIDVNEEKEVFLLPYVEMIRRCEETERRVLFLVKQCERHQIVLDKARSVEHLTQLIKKQAERRKTVSSGFLGVQWFYI